MINLLFLGLGNSMVYYLLIVPMLFISGWIASYCFPVSSFSYIFFTIAIFFLQIVLIVALLQWLAGKPLFT